MKQLVQFHDIGLCHLQGFVFGQFLIVAQLRQILSQSIKCHVQIVHASTFTSVRRQSSFLSYHRRHFAHTIKITHIVDRRTLSSRIRRIRSDGARAQCHRLNIHWHRRSSIRRYYYVASALCKSLFSEFQLNMTRDHNIDVFHARR